MNKKYTSIIFLSLCLFTSKTWGMKTSGVIEVELNLLLKSPINKNFHDMIIVQKKDLDEKVINLINKHQAKGYIIKDWITIAALKHNQDPYVISEQLLYFFDKKTINECALSCRSVYASPSYILLSDTKSLNRALWELNCNIQFFLRHIAEKIDNNYIEFTEETPILCPFFVRINGKSYVKTEVKEDNSVDLTQMFWEDVLRPNPVLCAKVFNTEEEYNKSCSNIEDKIKRSLKSSEPFRGTFLNKQAEALNKINIFENFDLWFAKETSLVRKQIFK